MRMVLLIAAICAVPFMARAEDRLVRLHAPRALVESGLMRHILPRFSLKTQIRVELVPEAGTADMSFGDTGRALFEGAGAIWHVRMRDPDHPASQRFHRWLTSDVGMRTIFGFAPGDTPLFTAPSHQPAPVAEVAEGGDADLGHRVSRVKCARCHAVDEASRKTDIGSTPSFFLLRALPRWQDRFQTFYVLNPHPSFTQVADVTPPFPHDRPSPIVPVEMTLDELEAVLAYVTGLAPADLGEPLQHQ